MVGSTPACCIGMQDIGMQDTWDGGQHVCMLYRYAGYLGWWAAHLHAVSLCRIPEMVGSTHACCIGMQDTWDGGQHA